MIELFRIMPGRYSALQATIDGYQRTDVPLVSFSESSGIGPAGFDDDMGSYYIIPMMVENFGLSLDTSIQLLYTGTVVLAFVVGAIGSWLYCKTRVGKLVSILALVLLSIIIAAVGDVYIFLAATAMALVPWWLYVQERCGAKVQLVYCMIAGLLIGAAHLMRSHSGTGVLIFIIISILLRKEYSKKLKLAFGIVLLASLLIVPVSFNNIVKQKQTAYLTSTGYDTHNLLSHHVFWHNIYLSLGYLNNPYGLGTSDVDAVYKVRSINPKVPALSSAYEDILRDETFRVIKDHPLFVINTVAAKIGVCLMYIIIFSNFGLILAVYYPKGYAFDLPFVAGIAFNMLFGILATPEYQYLLGLFAFATLYGVYSIDFSGNQRGLTRLRKLNEGSNGIAR